MLRVTYRQLSDRLAVTNGLDPVTGQVSHGMARQVNRALNSAVKLAWEFYTWPEVCRVVTDLALLNPGYDLMKVYAEDPQAAWDAGDREPVEVEWNGRQDEGGSGPVLIEGDDPDTAYYFVRAARPFFGSEVYDAARTYRRGEAVYDNTSGDSYVCVEKTNGAEAPNTTEPKDWFTESGLGVTEGDVYENRGRFYEATETHIASDDNEPGAGDNWEEVWEVCTWQPQRLPEFLEESVLAGAEAWLARTEHQVASAQILGKAMTGWLEQELIRLQQQGELRGGVPRHLRCK